MKTEKLLQFKKLNQPTTIIIFEIPLKQSGEARKRAGKKKRGSGGIEFLRARQYRAVGAVRVESGLPCIGMEAKPAEIDSLLEKVFWRPSGRRLLVKESSSGVQNCDQSGGSGFRDSTFGGCGGGAA